MLLMVSRLFSRDPLGEREESAASPTKIYNLNRRQD